MRNLVTRAEWGARDPRKLTTREPELIRWLVVHYSAAARHARNDHRECAGIVRGIQAFHMDANGWDDIGYTWLFCRHGYIFRGRGWRAVPAATSGVNTVSVAACFLGADATDRLDVTPEAKAALREIWAFCQRNAPNVRGVRGHRDFNPTACPGDELYRFARSLS